MTDIYLFMIRDILSEREKYLLLKAALGAGKSLYEKIASDKRRHKFEFLHCSADSNSIDGLVIPDYKVALLDGTAPHMIDPKFPGCVDNIINLGDYWDEDALTKNRAKIQETNEMYGRCYKRVYNYLEAAKIIFEDLSQI